MLYSVVFFFSSRRRHTRLQGDWSSDVCSSDLGIDPGEEPYPAALRELHEETNIRSVERLGEIAEWLTYDIPREIVGQEIGRASCREREGVWGGTGTVENMTGAGGSARGGEARR